MSLPTLGIDLAKTKFDVALLHDEQLRHHSFPNTSAGLTALLAWLQAQGAAQVPA